MITKKDVLTDDYSASRTMHSSKKMPEDMKHAIDEYLAKGGKITTKKNKESK